MNRNENGIAAHPTLEALGWNSCFEEPFAPWRAKGLQAGRVAVEDKHYYVLATPDGERTGQVSGKLLHSAPSPADLPKVGDWVAFAPLPQEAKGVIHQVLPRKTKLSRKVPGREIEEQVLAANIDTVFIVQALDATFNPALVQRHLVMVLESGAQPVVVLNKADLCNAIPDRVAKAKTAAGDVPIVVVSAKTTCGIPELATHIPRAQTVVFIGSSGVGKSTLINDLLGEELQATAEVREADAKGRHTTSWRELIMLPNGGIVIDTPGMREFHMWTAEDGLREAFADLQDMSATCHFRDCTHTVEKRCAILDAVARGDIPQERYQRFLKLNQELAELQLAQTRRARLQRGRRSRIAPRTSNPGKHP